MANKSVPNCAVRGSRPKTRYGASEAARTGDRIPIPELGGYYVLRVCVDDDGRRTHEVVVGPIADELSAYRKLRYVRRRDRSAYVAEYRSTLPGRRHPESGVPRTATETAG